MKHYTYIRQEPITLGWSHDLKFKATTKDAVHFIRISSIKQLNEEQVRFSVMKQLFELGCPIQKPLCFEVKDESIIQTFQWIEGDSCEDTINQYDEKTQYQLGVQAGKILKVIHSIPSKSNEDMAFKLKIKAEKKIAAYINSGIQLKHETLFLKWVEEGLSHLGTLHSTFQHGDYHVGNMLIKDKDLLVIDFNRSSEGDPWQEFDRIPFSVRHSPSFSKGQIVGYFDGQPPKAFYQRLKLYCAINTLSSIPWAINYSMKDVKIMQSIAEDIASWYQDDEWVPTWMK
ncbi:MAG: phosphotransferase [Erysipelotrichaceae bacterium]|nr:phosphotransferase [Erysipelotrichaceae bacterium]